MRGANASDSAREAGAGARAKAKCFKRRPHGPRRVQGAGAHATAKIAVQIYNLEYL